jgi:hypothetical protein
MPDTAYGSRLGAIGPRFARPDSLAGTTSSYSIVKQPPGFALSSYAGHGAFFVARMKRSEIRELTPQQESRIALRFIRATGVRTRVIAPCPVRPQGCRSSMFLHSPKGRAERQGVSPRPRRPHVVDAGIPHAAFAAHGRWSSPTPKIVELNRASDADLRLRSARGWIFRLAASLTRKFACADPARTARTVARACTWTVRPTRRRQSPVRLRIPGFRP